MSRTIKLRTCHFVLSCFVALTLVVVSTQSANAGTYTVNPIPCSTASPTSGQDGWAFGAYCGNFSAFYMQLNSTPDHPVGSPGTIFYTKYGRVRSGASITQLTLTRSSSGLEPDAQGTPRITPSFCLRTSGLADGWTAASDGGCAVLPLNNNGQPALTDSGSFTNLTYNSNCGGNCDGFQVRARSGATGGYLGISGISAIVDDTTNPTTSIAAGPAANSNQWVRGATVAIAADSSDTGGGIKSTALTIQSPLTTLKTVSASCDFATWNPCPTTRNWTSTFDSTQTQDGTYTARYTATDAGDRTASSANFSLRIDNTNPETPKDIESQTTGMNGWSSSNSFAASWTNGIEVAETQTQSGISAVVVDVEPTTGSQTDPAAVEVPVGGSASGISATLDSVSGVTVPTEGAWTLELALKDRAGNVSPVGAGSDPATDGKTSIGWDTLLPGSPDGQANGWISRDELAAGFDQEFSYVAPVGAQAPVCGFAGAIDKNINGTTGTSINVPGGGDAKTWRLPGTLDEATHYVHLRAVSCNGTVSQATTTVAAPVDRTDPVGSIDGVEDGNWYQDGKAVTLSAVDTLSGMAPADPIEPKSTAGAYLSYRVNGSGPADDDSPRGGSTVVNVTGEGQKTLEFSPVDFASNRAVAKTVNFGIDATDPIGYVKYPNSAKPTLLEASLSDVPSGVSYAVFSIKRQGGGSWEDLPTGTTAQGGSNVLASARFPDTEKDAGTYDVRVRAYDQAGNALATQRYQNGQVATVENPMRSKTEIDVKLFKALRTCTITKKKSGKKTKCIVKKCTKKSKGTCYRVLRGRVVLVGGSKAVTSEFKRGAQAVGVLSDENGKPLANTDVKISTTEKFSGKQSLVGETRTDSNGIYSLRVPAGTNRTVRATYEGSETRRPTSTTGELSTRAKMTIKLSKKRARTGQSVTFSGKVTPFDAVIPKGGKIVALQFYAAKKWRPAVGVAHTDANGKFRIKYTFDGAKVKAKIIFRVVAPSEDGWGHAYSVSKPKVIRLNF